jgi:hypothetical protein
MSRHRIFRSEADRPKPLAYIRVYPATRRPFLGYLTAALAGGVVAIGVSALLALMQNGFPA